MPVRPPGTACSGAQSKSRSEQQTDAALMSEMPWIQLAHKPRSRVTARSYVQAHHSQAQGDQAVRQACHRPPVHLSWVGHQACAHLGRLWAHQALPHSVRVQAQGWACPLHPCHQDQVHFHAHQLPLEGPGQDHQVRTNS